MRSALATAVGAGCALSAAAPASAAPGPPALSAAAQSHASWREGSLLPKIARSIPVGTTFHFALNEPARVQFKFSARTPQREVCVVHVSATASTRSCRSVFGASRLTFQAHAGVNTMRFYGRLSRSISLPLGGYTLALSARNAAGELSQPAFLHFTIVS